MESKNTLSTVNHLSVTIREAFLCRSIGWKKSPTDRTMFASSIESSIEVVFPTSPDNASFLHLVVFIRDRFDAVTELNLSSIFVQLDQSSINLFIESIQQSSLSITTENRLLQALLTGNQNRVSQVILTISQHFQQINEQTMNTLADCQLLQDDLSLRSVLILDGISPSTWTTSPLGMARIPLVSVFL